MVVSKSCISAGELVREVLMSDNEVKKLAKKIFPVMTSDKAELPYIVYRRMGLVKNSVMVGKGAFDIAMEIICYADNYKDSVLMAEAVVNALDNRQYATDNLKMRVCTLSNSEEGWQDDAYAQQLVFNLKIQ